ncbi:MAG: DUF6129 family protein [Dechloromonas sp.]|nr:DUF6129 family protein [Dechloromonas sp.]
MISSEKLQQVAAAARENASATALRAHFPELHFTECSEDDVSPRYKPASKLPGYALYLISGASGHCLELTNQAEAATGILIAATIDDE